MNLWTWLLMGFLALCGFLYFVRLAARTGSGHVRSDLLSWPDAIFASLLAALTLLLCLSMFQMISIVPSSESGAPYFHIVQKQPTAKVTIDLLLMGMAQNFSIIFLIFGVLAIRRVNPLAAFGLLWPEWRKGLAIAGTAWLAILPIVFLLQLVMGEVFGKDAAQETVLFFKDNPDILSRGALVFLAVVVAPLAEEIIFRGYIYGVMRRYGGKWVGMVLSSLIFALAHFHVPSIPGLFALAVALVLVYEKTGSLWATMAMHSAFNSLSILGLIFFPDLT
jgi:membrane protease YdiL (CAAX protease family)